MAHLLGGALLRVASWSYLQIFAKTKKACDGKKRSSLFFRRVGDDKGSRMKFPPDASLSP
jgi:hypothetical protein